MARSSTPADTLPSPLAPYGTIAFPSPLPLEQALEDRRCGRHPASVSRDELSVIAHKPVARHDVRTWRVQAAFDATVEHVGLDAASSVPGVVHVYVDVSEFA